MISAIFITVFGVLAFLWLLFSILTIFLMIKYNGLSITVWVITILYVAITLPILISGITGVMDTSIDFDMFIPRMLIQ